MNDTVKERYLQQYTPRVQAFLDEVGEVNADGIPQPHLPIWGSGYEHAKPKVLFAGMETTYWGEMPDFLAHAQRDLPAALFRMHEKMHALEFTGWTNNFGTTFWDVLLQFLAELHHVADWKELKDRKHEEVLRGFVWAQTNSIERFEITSQGRGADEATWQKIKNASRRHLDSFATLVNVFRPGIAIVMNWGVSDEFWDYPLSFQNIGDHVDYAFDDAHGTRVFHIAHPTWLRYGDRREGIFTAVLSKVNEG